MFFCKKDVTNIVRQFYALQAHNRKKALQIGTKIHPKLAEKSYLNWLKSIYKF